MARSQQRTVPEPEILHTFYRSTLRLTGRRGMRTLSRLNHRLFPGGQICRLATGCDFFVPPDPHFFGYIVDHERHVTRLIAELVEEGDDCVDVGANIGYFSLMMAARCGATGRVFAYEPEAGNFAALERNVALASDRGLTIAATRAAVSDRDGVIALVRGEESTLHQVAPAGVATPPDDVVPCVNLGDDLRRRGAVGPIKLLKIDVEGHETAVLRGSADFLAGGSVHTAVLEVTPGETAAEIDAILRGLGASARCWLDGGWRPHPVAEVPHRTDILIWF
jgi:FkbM family methyltransferase